MTYSPPAWNAVGLQFEPDYTPPPWDAVPLAFGAEPPPGPYVPPSWDAVALPFVSGYTPPQWDSVALAFGTAPEPPEPADAILATGQAQSITILGGPVTPAHLTAGEAQTADAVIDIRPFRPKVYAMSRTPWRRGTPQALQITLPWERPIYGDARPAQAWANGTPQDAQIALPWQRPAQHDRQRSITLSPGEPQQTQHRLPWGNSVARDHQRRTPWGRATAHQIARQLPWFNPPPRDQQRRIRWDRAERVDHQAWLATGRATIVDLQARLPWSQGTAPRLRWLPVPPYIPPPPPPPPNPCYTPPDWDQVRLRFDSANTYAPPPWDQVPLAFRCDTRLFRIARSLRVSHSLSVVRLPDLLPLNVTSVSMSTDRDSFAWSFALQFGDRASLLACAPSPSGVTSVRITLDGYEFVALIEDYQESRQIPRKQASASGRSRTALLAAPYDPERSYANEDPATAQQLALRELDFSGFALDWQLDDWTVSAGAWAYDRETHLGAILRIAAAAGGVVQAARDTDTVIVQPRHPVTPWGIAAADLDMTIEASACITLGKKYVAGAGYQGVYVSGRDQGVRVNVYRDGTSGSPYAELVIDPLITESTPAVARGKSILTGATTREDITLLLPLTQSPAAPGLLTPGQVLAVEDPTWGNYRAVTTSCQITAEVDGEGVLTARQTVGVERYITA